MRRREVIAGLAGAVTWPLVAQAQPPPTVRRIAIVHASNPIAQMNEGANHPYYPAFFAELRRLGYVEGHNLTVDRSYRLGVSLPSAPLAEFERDTAGLPRSTEAERIVVQRVGQDVFRRALLQYWEGCCAVTGIRDAALLRASHIVPWATCSSDAQRLDVHNGLLLSALWDAAFDGGLITFDNDGRVLAAPALTLAARQALGLDAAPALSRLRLAHREALAWHRANVFGRLSAPANSDCAEELYR